MVWPIREFEEFSDSEEEDTETYSDSVDDSE